MLEATVVGEVERAGRQRVGANEAAEAREAGARKFFLPRAGEVFEIRAGRNREGEFVILAVGERGAHIGSGAKRQRCCIDCRHGAARGERAEVFREAVAHVDHRADFSLAREPLAFGEARREFPVVFARKTVAE